MSRFEEILLHITVVVVALFAHKRLTYEFSVPKYAILSLMISILFFYLIFKWLRKKEIKIYFNMAHVGWFLFSLSAFLSTINVYRDNPSYFRYSIDIALFILLNFFVSVYISNTFRTKASITRFLLTILGTGTFVAFDAILNFYKGYDIFLGRVGAPFSRAAIKATVGNPIFVADYMGMLLPIAVYFILSYDFGWKERSYMKIVLIKTFSMISFLLMLITVIIAQTRSEYMSVFLSFVLFFVFYQVYRRKNKLVDEAEESLKKKYPDYAKKLSRLKVLFSSILIIFTALFIVLYNTPNPLTGGGKMSIARRVQAFTSVSSWDERMLSWLSSVYQWRDHKILGTGIGTYQVLTISYMGDIIKDHPRFIYGWNNFKRTHNDYLQVLGETGILGFLSIIFLLSSLVYYLFRVMKDIKDRDDALLFLSLAFGFSVFAMQSFFSFPGHLLPNGFAALFLASSAVGRYFAEGKPFSREVKIKGKLLVVLWLVLMSLTLTSTYLRWNYFVSEVYFKTGNSSYTLINKIRNELNKLSSYERNFRKSLEDLQKMEGQYSFLKPENFKRIVTEEFKKKGLTISDEEVEALRLKEIETQRSKIMANLEKVENVRKELSDRMFEEYKKALNCFLKCLNLNHTYGKSYFYLASLSLQPYRIEEIVSDLMNSKGKEFKNKLEKLLKQEYDAFQKMIDERYKMKDFLFLSKLPEDVLKEKLKIADVVTTQALLDSVGLYRTSLLYFNERNTYKALATRYNDLHKVSKILYTRLPDEFIEEKDLLKENILKYFDEFVKYAKQTIHNLPGAWNRFRDWKNPNVRVAVKGQDIYRYFAQKAFDVQPLTVLENYRFIKWLAENEVWACEMMDRVGVWGVPDMVMDFLHAASFSFYKAGMRQEALRIYEEILNIYRNTERRILKERSEWLDKASKSFEYALERVSEDLKSVLRERGLSNETLNIYISKFKSLFSDMVKEFASYNWLELVAKEMRALINEKRSIRYDPWRNILENKLKAYQEVLKGLDEEAKGEVLNLLRKELSQDTVLNIFERYLRFDAHYKLVLNDFDYMRSTVVKIYEKASGEDWPYILRDWEKDLILDKPAKTKEEVLRDLERLKELILSEKTELE